MSGEQQLTCHEPPVESRSLEVVKESLTDCVDRTKPITVHRPFSTSPLPKRSNIAKRKKVRQAEHDFVHLGVHHPQRFRSAGVRRALSNVSYRVHQEISMVIRFQSRPQSCAYDRVRELISAPLPNDPFRLS